MKTISLLAGLLALGAPGLAQAAFSITVNYDTSLTAQEQSGLDYARSFWESRLTGYTYDHGITGLRLYVGSGSYTNAVSGYVITTNGVQGSTYTAEEGVLEIDSASVSGLISAGTFNNAMTRAVGHALGFGMYGTSDSLLTVNGLTTSATAYTGANALAAFGGGATSLTIATISGSGVSEKGWNHTGLTNDLLASAPSNLALATLSATSLAAFKDIGYTVIPEPGVYGLAGASALAAVAAIRRRRR